MCKKKIAAETKTMQALLRSGRKKQRASAGLRRGPSKPAAIADTASHSVVDALKDSELKEFFMPPPADCAGDDWNAAPRTVVHEVVATLQKELVEGAWYTQTVTYLAKHMESANKNVAGVEIGVKAVQRELEKAFSAANESDLVAVMKDVARLGGKELAQSMKYSLHGTRGMDAVSVPTNCMGEIIIGLTGQMRVCGVKLGKLQGDLKQQLASFSAFTEDDIEEHADFLWHFSPAEQLGMGSVLVLPPDTIYCYLAHEGTTCLRWFFPPKTDGDSTRCS